MHSAKPSFTAQHDPRHGFGNLLALVLGSRSVPSSRPRSRKASVLDIIALAPSAVFVWHFMRTSGPEMLAHMEAPADEGHACQHHGHSHHHHHHHHHHRMMPAKIAEMRKA